MAECRSFNTEQWSAFGECNVVCGELDIKLFIEKLTLIWHALPCAVETLKILNYKSKQLPAKFLDKKYVNELTITQSDLEEIGENAMSGHVESSITISHNNKLKTIHPKAFYKVYKVRQIIITNCKQLINADLHGCLQQL